MDYPVNLHVRAREIALLNMTALCSEDRGCTRSGHPVHHTFPPFVRAGGSHTGPTPPLAWPWAAMISACWAVGRSTLGAGGGEAAAASNGVLLSASAARIAPAIFSGSPCPPTCI